MKKINELDKLISLLTDNNIDFETSEYEWFREFTTQVFVPNKENIVVDAVCHHGSYGHEQGRVELMMHDTGEIFGNLDAETALNIIKNKLMK